MTRWLLSMGLIGVLLASARDGLGADPSAGAGPAASSDARLVVEVIDAEGKRIPGALVTVDGLPAGRTDADGRFVESGRPAGEILAIGIRAPGDEGVKVSPIRLVPGDQTHVLALDMVVIIDTDADGVAEPGDACVGAAEVVNGYADGDGCPDALAAVTVEVTDPDGFPARDAAVSIDGAPVGRTDDAGRLLVADRMPGEAVRVQAAGGGWADGVAEITPGEGEQAIAVTLGRPADAASKPPVLTIVAVDAAGAPVAGGLVVVDGHKQGKTGPDGVFEYTGRAAGVNITIAVATAAGDRHAVGSLALAGGPQRTRLVVEETDEMPAEIVAAEEAEAAAAVAAVPTPGGDRDGDGFYDRDDACPDGAETKNGHADGDGCPDELASLAVWVIDADGKAVPGATVLVDGQEAGRTGDDGSWLLADQVPGRALTLGVRAEHREAADGGKVTLAEGRQAQTVALASKDTDGDGIVDRDDRCLHEPERVNGFRDDDGCVDALATLAVTAVASDGAPLPDLQVRVNGSPAGRTGADGRLLLTDKMPGTEVEVSPATPDGFLAASPSRVALVEGPQALSFTFEREAVPEPEPVAVVAPPEPVAPPAPSDSDGDGLADPDDRCFDSAETKNGYADDDGCPDALADVAITVTGADGAPLAGALFTSAGRELGRSGKDGVYRAAGLMPGAPATWAVSLPGYEGAELPATWAEGEQRVSLALKPADRDGDGLADLFDACPAEAEVVNGWREEDGCPDQLATLDLVVTGDGGTPLAGAVVSRGGAEVGRTDAAGRLVLADLLPGSNGAFSVSVPGTDYGVAEVSGDLAEGRVSRPVALARGDADGDGLADGSDACPDKPEVANGWKDADGCPDKLSTVFLTATDPAGAPLAGVVVRVGAEELGRTDAKGELKLPDRMPGTTIALTGSMPGTDRPDVTLPSLQLVEGAMTQSMVLARRDGDGDGLFDADDQCATAAETPNGYADADGCPDTLGRLVVEVKDADGKPLAGAPVRADGREAGRTDAAGQVTLVDLMPGRPVSVAVGSPDDRWVAADLGAVNIVEGDQKRAARLERAAPKDADGDGLADPDDGCADRPETKNGYADGDGCPDALGTVVVKVAGPDGSPVAGAAVTAGGKSVGRTGADGTVRVSDAMPGTDLALGVTGEGYEPSSRSHRVAEGEQSVALSLSRTPPKDTDGDGLVDPDDGCADRPETKNGYADGDGCPDALGTLVVKVAGPDGSPVAGAAVTAGGKSVGRTGADGTVRVSDAMPGTDLALGVTGEGFEPASRSHRVAEGEQSVALSLSRTPPKDTDGDGLVDPDDACAERPETKNGYADADGCPDALGTVVVKVAGPDGSPVAGAAVTAGGKSVGRTGADGTVRVADAMPGTDLALGATGEGFEPASRSHRVAEGEQSVALSLSRTPPKDTDGDGLVDPDDGCADRPETKNGYADGDGCPDALGTLVVKVAGPDGSPVAGAAVTAGGKSVGRTGADGTVRVSDAMPGTDLALGVTGEGFEPASRSHRVAEGEQSVALSLSRTPPKDTDGDGLVDADDACADRPETKNGYADGDGCPDALGTLVVKVTGPDGQPIAGAAVRASGNAVGRTAADGSIRVADAMPGTDVEVTATGDGYEPATPRRVRVAEGEQAVALSLSRAAPKDGDGDGLADADDQCPDRPETKNGHADGDGCPDALATVVVHVLDPDGRPVSGATVSRDGKALGRTDGSGFYRLADVVPTGTLTLTVDPGDGFERATTSVGLSEGEVKAPVDVVRSAPKDADLDGIIDSVDRCPDRPENKNGVADDDGCPEQFASVRVEATDGAGAPVPGAEIRVGGAVMGHTDASGVFVLAERIVGATVLIDVIPPAATGLMPQAVQVDSLPEDGVTRPVKLVAAGKGVRVVVRSTETGAGIPAMAVLFGPVEDYEGGNPVIDVRTGELVVEVPLGDDGEEVLDLPPGSWRIVLLGKDHLPEERTLEVAPGSDQVLEVNLLPRRRGPPPAPR